MVSASSSAQSRTKAKLKAVNVSGANGSYAPPLSFHVLDMEDEQDSEPRDPSFYARLDGFELHASNPPERMNSGSPSPASILLDVDASLLSHWPTSHLCSLGDFLYASGSEPGKRYCTGYCQSLMVR